MQFETPILLLIFNRKDSALKVIDEIRKRQPKYLFVAADGPRSEYAEDKEKCKLTREAVLNSVNWQCEVKTLFKEENRGCGHGPAEAISWFFDNVEQGIILEDDILPAESFFKFCEELLNRYKDDSQIMSIGGTNFLSGIFNISDSYVYSEYTGNWGWASWRRAWKGFDYNISAWASKTVKQQFKKNYSNEQYLFFEEVFNTVCNKNVSDAWDYQWWFHRLLNRGIGITPAVNLTKNIGFNADATHTFNVSDEVKNASVEELHLPLVHPTLKTANKEYDLFLARKYYWKKPENKLHLLKKVLNKFK